MSLDKLFEWVIVIIIGFALVGKLDAITRWVHCSQAKLVYQSRASAWGNPSIFKDASSTSSSVKNSKSIKKMTTFKGGTNE